MGERLAAAFAVQVAILLGLLFFHVGTIRESVRAGRDLSETSARLHANATEQTARIGQLEETLSKYAVTADSGYLAKFEQVGDEFTAALDALAGLPLEPRERRALVLMDTHWQTLRQRARALTNDTLEPALLADSTRALGPLFVGLYQRAGSLEGASQAVLADRLAASAAAAVRAERVSWIAAAIALLLSILVPGLFVRSISRELHALQAGTRAVARGDFDYRLRPGSTRDFAQLATDFNTMTRRLGELDSMQREFLSRVSHDLKTPLASMRETVNVLLDEVAAPLTPQQRTLLQLNNESGDRLAAMIAKLLNLASLEAGTPVSLVPHDAAAIARAAARAATIAGRERGIRVLVHAAGESMVRCDAERLRQLFDNLLENALKFSPRGSTVGIIVHRTEARSQRQVGAAGDALEPHVLIAVRDQGPGIPEDARERIFERFYQTKQGRSVPGRGVGLGLAISREIVQLHGGTIHVEPRKGAGSEFRVLLPALETGAPRHAPEGALV